MRVYTLSEVADLAADRLHLFDGKEPDLVPTGIGPVDEQIVGLEGGEMGILAMGTGIGKSSMALMAAMGVSHDVGMVQAEDLETTVGSRALSRLSGISTRKMRRGGVSMSPDELMALSRAQEALRGLSNVKMTFPPRRTLEGLREASRALLDEGVEMLWLDYLQKFGGTGLDRRAEVGAILNGFQEVLEEYRVPGMILSQFKRRQERTKKGEVIEPALSDLFESSYIEIFCRLAVLGWTDEADERMIRLKMAKSTHGGQGTRFSYRRDGSGSLRRVDWTDAEF